MIMTEKEERALRDFTLLSNSFMMTFFQDLSFVQKVLRKILSKPNLIVTEVQTEYALQNLQKHSARLDILAVDAENKYYDIEIQCESKDFPPKRARYYSSIMDTKLLPIGEKYHLLPETYVIVIGKNDILGKNLPIYHIHRIIEESNELFADETNIIYVNCQIAEATELGELVHDLKCKNASDMLDPDLAARMRFLKESEEGKTKMCEVMERYKAEVATEVSQSEKQGFAKNMLRKGKLSYDEIADYSGLPVEIILKLAKEQSA